MLHRIAPAPSRRRRGPVRRPRTPWRRWRSLRVGTTTGRPGTETQCAGRGRTVEAQWQSNRPLTLSHQAPIEAPRRESGDYQGKGQAGRERTAPICRLTSASRMNRRENTKSGPPMDKGAAILLLLFLGKLCLCADAVAIRDKGCRQPSHRRRQCVFRVVNSSRQHHIFTKIPNLYNPPGQINPNRPAARQARLRHRLAQGLSEAKLAPYGPYSRLRQSAASYASHLAARPASSERV